MNRILIVDGFEIFRRTVRELAEASGRFSQVHEARSGAEYIEALKRRKDLAMIVVHPRSIRISEADCLRLAERLAPGARVILFRDHAGEMVASIDTGRVTLLPRSCSCDELLKAMRRIPAPAAERTGRAVATGHAAISESITRSLSRRQRQIMAMVAEGLANKEIAHRLGIAEGTVKAHIHAVFRALGVRNRTQAVVLYGPELRAAVGEA